MGKALTTEGDSVFTGRTPAVGLGTLSRDATPATDRVDRRDEHAHSYGGGGGDGRDRYAPKYWLAALTSEPQKCIAKVGS